MARPAASERARRLIALMGRLTNGARLSIDDLARQVGSTPAELASDLETLSMCGVGGYDPSELVPVLVEDGYVEVWGAVPALQGPVRLSAGEATALAAALQAAGFSAEDPLTRKLLAAASAGFDAADLELSIRSAIASHESGIFETLARAVQAREVTRIEYVSAGAVTSTTRDIEPATLFTERGAWYLTAWCRLTGAWRTFRVDRVREASTIGEQFATAARTGFDASISFDDSSLPTARLRFAPGESFTRREWPGARVVATEPDGSVLTLVPFGGPSWITRQVVARLGAVEVIEPLEVREAVRRLAQEKLRRA